MTPPKNITRTFLYSMVIIAVVTVITIGYFWIYNEYDRFKDESNELRDEYLEAQRKLIKTETEKVVEYIQFKKKEAEERYKQNIKMRVQEAFDIAMNLYQKNKDSKSSIDIQELIKEALRPIKFNHQRGYYFITRLDGVEILFADQPHMEGLNLIEMQDTEGRYVIKDMISIIRDKGEGFYRYSWTKPNQSGRNFPKIAYIIHFEPFNWLIGTGEYLDDIEKDIKNEVLARVENISFSKDGYIFAGQWDGLSLLYPAKGRNMIDVTDVNGVKIVQELIKTAKSGGGYVRYVIPNFDRNETFKKLSYTVAIPEWQWYLGAGVNVERIETVISKEKTALKQRVRNHILKIVVILASILILILLLARFVSNRIQRSFDQFTSFFSRAVSESSEIEFGKFHFVEFENLAKSANQIIAERNKAEQALRESEKNYRELVENANSIIMRMDITGNIIFFNTYAQKFFGYQEDEIIGRNVINTIVPPKDTSGFDLSAMIEDITTHPERHVANENENILRNGERVRVAWMNKGIYDHDGLVKEILCVGIDVTEKWQLQKRLSQAQKMEAIGTLAGGIAHDFNNILSAIIGYSELALVDMQADTALKNNMQQILAAGGRAKELVQQILTFSRQRRQEMLPLRLDQVVGETLKLLRASLPATIEIQTIIETKAAVMADPTNIHQVIMNLCTNAGYAMREKGGSLEIRLADIDIDVDFVKKHPEIRPGKFIQLSIKDTGHGIEPELVERIFDPFFTTKDTGEGTGMGLAVVHGIVKTHGGAITLSSEPGAGSTFNVLIPAIVNKPPVTTATQGDMPVGSERILFVDDESFQADLGRQMLERLGYQVTSKTSSIEALEVFQAAPQTFDLIITDMTMPNMTGDELSRKILAIRPDIPIIVCTGYSERISDENIKAIGIKRLAMKPIVMRNIANIIREVLD